MQDNRPHEIQCDDEPIEAQADQEIQICRYIEKRIGEKAMKHQMKEKVQQQRNDSGERKIILIIEWTHRE